MGNYKGIKFGNSMDDFKRWVKAFPPLDADAVKAQGFKRHEDYYLELQLVSGFLSAGKFVSVNVRKYDREEKNFENVDSETQKELMRTVFKYKLEAFKEKHKAGCYE